MDVEQNLAAGASLARPAYPVALERLVLDLAAARLGIADHVRLLESLREEAGRLSDFFTCDRPAGVTQDYFADERLLCAYSLFFLPQTFVRVDLILNEVLAGGVWRPPAAELRLLDLGAGTGAAGLSILARLRADGWRGRAEFCALDRSAAALDWLQALWQRMPPEYGGAGAGELRVSRGDLRQPPTAAGAGWDIIVASFALNEACEGGSLASACAWLETALERLAPGGLLLLCEPALKVSAERVEGLRDHVCARRLATILGPCQHHAACPLRMEGGNWCHEVRRWRVPETVEFINRRLQRTVQFLKFSFLALRRAPSPVATDDATLARLIAPLMEERGKILTRGCAADGQAHPYEFLTRGLDRPARERILETERGAIVRWPALRLLGDGVTLRAAGPLAHPFPALL